MAKADEYAKWLVDNQDKSDTEDFRIVAQAYEQAKAEEGAGLPMAEPSLAEPLSEIGAVAAARPAASLAAASATDAYKLAKIAGQVTPKIAGEFLSTPIQSTKDLASAYVAGHPYAGRLVNMPFGQMPAAALKGMAGLALAPENILAAPYMMAAYEQEKMKANPQAYPNQPYAQVLRGEYPTEGAAGRANRRRAIYETPSSYQPTPIEAENILASGDERMIKLYGGRDALTAAIRRKAAERVLQ